MVVCLPSKKKAPMPQRGMRGGRLSRFHSRFSLNGRLVARRRAPASLSLPLALRMGFPWALLSAGDKASLSASAHATLCVHSDIHLIPQYTTTPSQRCQAGGPRPGPKPLSRLRPESPGLPVWGFALYPFTPPSRQFGLPYPRRRAATPPPFFHPCTHPKKIFHFPLDKTVSIC